MNIAKGGDNLNLFMPQEELEDFKRYLSNAIEDLINVRPDNPKKYLALALCKAIPVDESIKFEFPELAKDITIEEQSKIEAPSKIEESESPSKKFDYPEGFQINRRGSVAGEPMEEEDLSWSPPIYPKEPEALEKLKTMLLSNILFSHLGEENLTIVALALEPLEVGPNEIVVKQYEEGHSCYFIESGKLSCHVEERGFVCEYNAGDSFGEVSIMYDNIRGATIKVKNI
jgi:cAMP-binding proteins - catabolite gene activator and regulatory subunit of cAMP-dependent protein kinases